MNNICFTHIYVAIVIITLLLKIDRNRFCKEKSAKNLIMQLLFVWRFETKLPFKNKNKNLTFFYVCLYITIRPVFVWMRLFGIYDININVHFFFTMQAVCWGYLKIINRNILSQFGCRIKKKCELFELLWIILGTKLNIIERKETKKLIICK